MKNLNEFFPYILGVLHLVVSSITAQTIDTLAAPSVSVGVKYNRVTQVYTYNYTVTNPVTSTGSIDWFELTNSRPLETAVLDMNGITVGKSAPIVTVDMEQAVQESLVTTVSFPSCPDGWTVPGTRKPFRSSARRTARPAA